MQTIERTKRIEEVFPDLELDENTSEYISLARVDRLALSKKSRTLFIFLDAGDWIHKKYIYSFAQAVEKQLAPEGIAVEVEENFHLSEQYTARKLMAVYRSSIELECRKKDRFLLHTLVNAKINFPSEDEMELILEDTAISRKKEKELTQLLKNIFCKRCHLKLQIRVDYYPSAVDQRFLQNEHRLQMEAARIFREAGLLKNPERAETLEGEKEGPEAVPSGAGDASGASSRTTSGSRSAFRNGARRTKKRPGASPFVFHTEAGSATLYGRDFSDESIPISSISESTVEATVAGQITAMELRDLKNEKVLLRFALTDGTDTIEAKIFFDASMRAACEGLLKEGNFVKVKGSIAVDSWEHELMFVRVHGIRKSGDYRSPRMDHALQKRVELHCHTKMSDMDGVTDVGDLIRQAYRWGWPALAITDHGGVQAFPDANHALEDIDAAYRKQYQKDHPESDEKEIRKIAAPFKILYGMEAYIVDDGRGIAINSKNQRLDGDFVVFDLETTGLSNETCAIIEIGAVRVQAGRIIDRFSTFVNPRTPIPHRIEELTGISDPMVIGAPGIEKVLPDFLDFCKGTVLVAHNADFDIGFIEKNCDRLGFSYDFTYVDTVAMARLLLPKLSRFKLDTVARALNVPLDNHHRAVDDAECTALIFIRFSEMLNKRGILALDDLNAEGRGQIHAVRKLPSYHAILLAKNETGRVNLYRCVSASHLDYFQRKPKLPKSVLEKNREGLIVGTACVAGELYQALLRGAGRAEIARLVHFYDYLEIQPTGNLSFLIEDEKTDRVRSIVDIQDINKKIVKLGEQFHKPVVATSDVHFMNPEDEIYRRIIMKGKKFADADRQAPLFLRTTDEMLKEFSYLGERKAREVVIDNPVQIAASIDRISPIRKGKFPPIIPNSDKMLREICYRRAHEIYGDALPRVVEDRLERELTSIISNGYAVMYIIAQKLVWKANEDGYLVGSRGSVGSSFVATMSGVTEVNPLQPHYLCESCKYADFDSEIVLQFNHEGKCGVDLPDAVCPKCGKPLTKLGFNIPFETFLGFKGNKEPDIDLNFSGEYQSKAHKYTEVIFGAGQTFRAGTIGTLADKTAFGFVKNYYEEKGEHKRNCEIDRIVKGCVGIRRTTGQHPGGIIVLPFGEDINSFTPVQHPADDPESDIITTHFDYHSIDENLLKLDILGHDDPTMIRMLEDLTGTDATKVPLDEPKVMSLFRSTEALGITPEDIGGCPLGSLGVPEMGTDFVMQMLMDTNPQQFSDLIRISGLSHGTNVWLGNAQKLIEEGKCTLSTAICTRDDIMNYLIAQGLDKEESFTIMESVRKGKGLKNPAWIPEMKKHGVPDWYIWSCEQIKYMFPKGHAVAYVMMAYRIAWYKIYYPLAYYAAYFSIRASAFSYEKMCMGRERLNEYLSEYRKRKDIKYGPEALTKLEQDMLKDMRVVEEMYARGYDFVPVDLYQAEAHRFRIAGEKQLMPAIDTIDGLGTQASDGVALAARDGKFLSKDDFRKRARVGKSISDNLERLGILKDLPETNQISIFDFTGGNRK